MSAKKSDIKCVNGSQCFNPGCGYIHDVNFCSVVGCTVRHCPYRHQRPCKHGRECFDPQCAYKHDIDFCSVVGCSLHCCPFRHPQLCKYGNTCKYTPNCRFRHIGENWCHPNTDTCGAGKAHCIYHPKV